MRGMVTRADDIVVCFEGGYVDDEAGQTTRDVLGG